MIDDLGSAFTAVIELVLLALRIILFVIELLALLVVILIERQLRLFGMRSVRFCTELRSDVKRRLDSLRKELRSGLRTTALFVIVGLMTGGVWLGWHFGCKRPLRVVMDGKPAAVTFEVQSWTGSRKIASGADGIIRVPRFWNYTLTTRGLMEEPQHWSAEQVGQQITVMNEPMGVSLLKKAAGAVREKLDAGNGR